MAGFIGFIIVMAVLGNVIDGMESQQVAWTISALLAAMAGYKFTKRNLAIWKKVKDENKIEEQKAELRKEIEEEKRKIASIQEAQQFAPEEPYYPEVKYFNQ